MQKKNRSSPQIILDFKIHYKAGVIHYCWKDKHADQWNRRENPELELHVDNQLVFWQWCQVINGERKVFTTNGVGTTGYTHGEKN